MYGPGDVRVEQLPDPELEQPTDALVRVGDLRPGCVAVGVRRGVAVQSVARSVGPGGC
jgi:hypothetical protein